MVKKVAELTPKQKALSAAKITLDKAREADEKSSNATTKKALADAETAHTTANNAVKRENFVRVGGGRVKKARIAIRNLGNINSLRTYTYTQADIDAAEKGIMDMWANAKAKMVAGLATKAATATAPKDEFSFGE